MITLTQEFLILKTLIREYDDALKNNNALVMMEIQQYRLRSPSLDALAVKELMLQLSDYAQNTTAEIQVFMVLEQKGLKNIIKLDKKIC